MKIAAYQMNVGPDPEANLERIAYGIEQAAVAGADLIALPECALPGYPPHFQESPADIDTPRIAELNEEVRALAEKHNIAVVLGTILMSSDGLLNSALVISREGEILGRYDKLHLMPGDKRFFIPGATLPLFEIDEVPIGILICYDVRFPEPFRFLREIGAQVIVNVFNACRADVWKRPVLEGTVRARAAENSCFVVAVNAAGPDQMLSSRIVGPLGLDLAAAELDTEQMLTADIDLAKTEKGYFFDRRTDIFEVRTRLTIV